MYLVPLLKSTLNAKPGLCSHKYLLHSQILQLKYVFLGNAAIV